MVEPAPNTSKLDDYLKDMIQAAYAASNVGVAHLKDDPEAVDQAVTDLEEILGTIMEGNVDEWVSS
ncbi:MAG: hypothetical protein GEU73_07375 [Chloroflexi bacterium]|nr:hypothetical protein [Chloroflexota bacterium]